MNVPRLTNTHMHKYNLVFPVLNRICQVTVLRSFLCLFSWSITAEELTAFVLMTIEKAYHWWSMYAIR